MHPNEFRTIVHPNNMTPEQISDIIPISLVW
jgi:hypothetical protein